MDALLTEAGGDVPRGAPTIAWSLPTALDEQQLDLSRGQPSADFVLEDAFEHEPPVSVRELVIVAKTGERAGEMPFVLRLVEGREPSDVFLDECADLLECPHLLSVPGRDATRFGDPGLATGGGGNRSKREEREETPPFFEKKNVRCQHDANNFTPVKHCPPLSLRLHFFLEKSLTPNPKNGSAFGMSTTPGRGRPKTQPDRCTAPCTPPCDRPVHTKGLCAAHMARLRSGRPIDTPIRDASPVCAFPCTPPCDRPAVANGLCAAHDRRTRRGSSNAAAVAPVPEGTFRGRNTVSIRISDAIAEALDEAARESGSTRAEYVRRIVATHLIAKHRAALDD